VNCIILLDLNNFPFRLNDYKQLRLKRSDGMSSSLPIIGNNEDDTAAKRYVLNLNLIWINGQIRVFGFTNLEKNTYYVL
jgi:hypothetical protein